MTFKQMLRAFVVPRITRILRWPSEPQTDYLDITLYSNKNYSSKSCEKETKSDRGRDRSGKYLTQTSGNEKADTLPYREVNANKLKTK